MEEGENVSEIYSFFNSKDHDRLYDARNWADYFFPLFKSGVFNGDLQVVANEGMSVKINTEYAWIDGYGYHLTDGLVLDLETASGNMNRMDSIVIRLDLTNRWVKAFCKSGSYYTGIPIPPIPEITTTIHEIVIAHILVTAGKTSITQDMIADTRMDETICGWVCGAVTQITFEQIYEQFKAFQKSKEDEIGNKVSEYEEWKTEFIDSQEKHLKSTNQKWTSELEALLQKLAEFKDNAETEYNNWFAGSTNDWTDEIFEWFNNLKEQLTENVAFNLQKQIGNLNELKTETKESLTSAVNEVKDLCHPDDMAYSPDKKYKKGDCCIYQGVMYRALTDIPAYSGINPGEPVPTSVEWKNTSNGEYAFIQDAENPHKWVSDNGGVAGDAAVSTWEINIPCQAMLEGIPLYVGKVTPVQTHNGVLTVTLDGEPYAAAVSGGTNAVPLWPLQPGKHTLTASYAADGTVAAEYDISYIILNAISLPEGIPGMWEPTTLLGESQHLTQTDNETIQRDIQGRLSVPALGRVFRGEIKILSASSAELYIPLNVDIDNMESGEGWLKEGDLFFCDINPDGETYSCQPGVFNVTGQNEKTNAAGLWAYTCITGEINQKTTEYNPPYITNYATGSPGADINKKGFTILRYAGVIGSKISFQDLLNGYTNTTSGFSNKYSSRLAQERGLYQAYYNAMAEHAYARSDAVGTEGEDFTFDKEFGGYLLIVISRSAGTWEIYGETARLIATPFTGSTKNVTSLALGTSSNTGFTITLGNFKVSVKASSASYLVDVRIYRLR